VECQAAKTSGASPLFVDEISVIFRKGFGNIDKQLELAAEYVVRLPNPKGNLKSFQVNSSFEHPLHPLRLGNINPQQRNAVRLGISLHNFPDDITTERRAMECTHFAPKLSRITAHAEEGSHRVLRPLTRLMDAEVEKAFFPDTRIAASGSA
jgi:hypothetical protein